MSRELCEYDGEQVEIETTQELYAKMPSIELASGPFNMTQNPRPDFGQEQQWGPKPKERPPVSESASERFEDYLDFLQKLDGSTEVGPDDMTEFEMSFMASNLSRWHNKPAALVYFSPKQEVVMQKLIAKYGHRINWKK